MRGRKGKEGGRGKVGRGREEGGTGRGRAGGRDLLGMTCQGCRALLSDVLGHRSVGRDLRKRDRPEEEMGKERRGEERRGEETQERRECGARGEEMGGTKREESAKA